MTIDQLDYDTSGCPETDRGNWMQLGGGRIFYPLDPRPEEVFIEDVARSLSRTMRYNGLSDEPVSVAQHSVQAGFLACEDGINNHWVLAILLHDASETFIGDMIRPIKMHMPEFRKIEAKVAEAVGTALNIPYCPQEVIKKYDNLAWAWEKRDLFTSSRAWPNTPELPDNLHIMKSWSMKNAETAFLVAYGLAVDAVRRIVVAEDDVWEKYTDTRDWRAV